MQYITQLDHAFQAVIVARADLYQATQDLQAHYCAMHPDRLELERVGRAAPAASAALHCWRRYVEVWVVAVRLAAHGLTADLYDATLQAERLTVHLPQYDAVFPAAVLLACIENPADFDRDAVLGRNVNGADMEIQIIPNWKEDE